MRHCTATVHISFTTFCSRFAGPAVELLQSFALHLQFHLRILLEDLRVSLAKHLSQPFIGCHSFSREWSMMFLLRGALGGAFRVGKEHKAIMNLWQISAAGQRLLFL